MSQALLKRNRNFRLLFSATAVSNLGDGVSALAFPWLATLITRDPFLIGLVAASGRLPWLLLTAPAGVVTDRADRQRLLVWSDIVRFGLTGLVLLLILSAPALPLGDTSAAALPLVAGLAGLAFLLGSAEVLRDNAAQTALPSVVDKVELERANGQIWSVEQVMGSFVGPPLAGFLIALAVPLPFAFDALTFIVAAGLVGMMTFPKSAKAARTTSFLGELAEGFRWLTTDPTILRLAIFLGFINLITMANLTLLVLFAQEVLGLSAIGYGILMTASAAGGVLGGLVGPLIVGRIGANRVFLLSQVGFITMPVAIWLSSSAFIVAGGLFVSMFSAVAYNVVTVSYRQRKIPDALLGRVNSLYRMFGWGMMPVGALLGGLTVTLVEPSAGREAALRLPYMLSVLGMLALLVWSARTIHLPDPPQ